MSDASAPVIVEIDGRGSLVSNVSTFAGEPQNFVSFIDLITDLAGRIRKRPGKGAALGAAASSRITAVFEYIFTNTTTGAVTYWRLRTFGTKIQYRDTGTGVWTDMTLPYSPASSAWVFVNAKNKVLAVNGADDMIFFDGTGVTWKAVGQDGPAAAMTYSLGGTYSTGTITGYTQGSAIINGTGTTWDTSGAWSGKYIDINGIRYTISNVNSNTQIQLTEGFKEASAGPALSYSIHFGVMDWDLSPRYAYAFYNPTTGHCSNIRSSAIAGTNILQFSEQNQVGVTPTLTIAASATNQAAYQAGYTQIKIFRTPKNAGILVAIDTAVNNVNSAVASISFTETATTGVDTALTSFEAPIVINRKPPAGLVSIVYHQGRLFAISRTGVFYCAIDPEVSIGVPEECWPAKYFLNIPEPLGLLTVGGAGGSDNIIIQTNRGDRSIDGYDVRTFYDYVLPNRKTGCAQYNAIAIDGDLLALYSDKRLVAYPDGSDLGPPIQDKLDAISSTLVRTSRLHWFTYQSRDFIFLSVPKASGSSDNDYTYVLNRDSGRWHEWNVGFTAFGTVHNSSTGALELWAGDSAGNVWQLLGTSFQDGGGNFAPTFTSSLIRPFGPEVKARLQYVSLFVSDGASIPTGKLFIEEQSNAGATDGSAISTAFRVAEHDKQSAQGRELIWTPDETDRVTANCFQLQLTFPSIAGDYYFDKVIAVFDPDQDSNVAARA